ncbi:MAG: protoglobin domain-containing protein [Myxococcales bacterium]
MDEAYVQSRKRIGSVHAHIGLSPQWYLASFNIYLDLIGDSCHALTGWKGTAAR